MLKASVRLILRGPEELRHIHGYTLVHMGGHPQASLFLLEAAVPLELHVIVTHFERSARARARFLERSEHRLVFELPDLRDPLISTIIHHGGSILYPIITRDHTCTVTILAPDRVALQRILPALGDHEGTVELSVLSVAEVTADAFDGAWSPTELVGGLTQRQFAALTIAVEQGYYEFPRQTSAEAMAAKLGITRTTFDEHLRKAERHLLSSFGNLLKTYPMLRHARWRRPGRPPALAGRARGWRGTE